MEDAIAAQDAVAAAFTPPSPAEPPEPAVDEHAARKAKAITRVRQLESQLIESEPGELVQSMSSGWRALAEADEPFASNVRKRSRPARYWES